MPETQVEIALATLVVCYALSRWRLSVIVPYAFIASQLTSYENWAAVTLLLFFFGLLDKVLKAVMDG